MRLVVTSIIAAGLVLVLGVVNFNIVHKQRTVDDGQRVLLRLRPVDPRSLMQGDFMRLRYAEQTFPAAAQRQAMPLTGTIVLALDAQDVGTYVRVDDGSSLSEREVRLEYKLNPGAGDLRLGAESFFFQEGQADLYADARYGVLRVDDAGASVLVGLADEAGVEIVVDQ